MASASPISAIGSKAKAACGATAWSSAPRNARARAASPRRWTIPRRCWSSASPRRETEEELALRALQAADVEPVPGRADDDLVDAGARRQRGDEQDGLAEVLGLQHARALVRRRRHRALLEDRRRHRSEEH